MPKLKKGDLVTVIAISSWMATTTRATVYATGEYVERNGESKPVFKDTPRSRKKYTLTFKPDQLVFVNLPREVLTLDSEVSTVSETGFRVTSYSGNACFNFMQTPLEIQAIIASSNVNPLFNEHNRILSHATTPAQLAYPDQYQPGTHAVIDRLITPQHV